MFEFEQEEASTNVNAEMEDTQPKIAQMHSRHRGKNKKET